MRLTVICGLDHSEHEDIRHFEAARLLIELGKKLNSDVMQLKAGDTFILRDVNGNRVGVCDITEH